MSFPKLVQIDTNKISLDITNPCRLILNFKMSHGEKWYLRRQVPEGKQSTILPLREGINKLGRGVGNHIRCLSLEVSREHCHVTVEESRITVKDNASFNGTFVGETRIPKLREVTIVEGDVIGLGTSECVTMTNYLFELVPEGTGDRENSTGGSDSTLCVAAPSCSSLGNVVASEENNRKRHASPCSVGPPSKVARSSEGSAASIEIVDLEENGETKEDEKGASPPAATSTDAFRTPEVIDLDPCPMEVGPEDPPVPTSIPGSPVGTADSKEGLSLRIGATYTIQVDTDSSEDIFEKPATPAPRSPSASFSKAEEDVIEIDDSDDEFPCSQLFDRIPEAEIKTEKSDGEEAAERESDDDIQILEEELSFFEDHFSQLSQQEPPKEEEKTGGVVDLDDDVVLVDPASPLKPEFRDSPTVKEEAVEEKLALKEILTTTAERETPLDREVRTGDTPDSVFLKVKPIEVLQYKSDNRIDLKDSSGSDAVNLLQNELLGGKKRFKVKKRRDSESSVRPRLDKICAGEPSNRNNSGMDKGTAGELISPSTSLPGATDRDKEGSRDTSHDENGMTVTCQSLAKAVWGKICPSVPEAEKPRSKDIKPTGSDSLSGQSSSLKLCEALPLPSRERAKKPQLDKPPKKGKIKTTKEEKNVVLSKEEKNIIAEERKQRLKELTMKGKSSKQQKEEQKTAPPANCAKVTDRNRGSFLMENILKNKEKIADLKLTLPRIPKKKVEKTNPEDKESGAESQKVNGVLEESRPVKDDKAKGKRTRRRSRSKDKTKEDKSKNPPEEITRRKSNRINSKKSVMPKNGDHPKLKEVPGPSRTEKDENRRSEVSQTDNNKKVKKCLRFADNDKLVSVRVYECEGILRKIFKSAGKDLHMSSQQGRTKRRFLEGVPLTESEILYEICKWSTKWIEESNLCDDDPPLAYSGLRFSLKDEYVSYSDYYRSIHSTMFHEIWAGILHDFRTHTGNSFFGGIRIKNNFNVQSHTQGVPIKVMELLQCCVLLSAQDIKQNSYPKKGDYILIQVMTKNGNENENSERNVSIKQSLFGYVSDMGNISKLLNNRDPFVQSLMEHLNASTFAKGHMTSHQQSFVNISVLIRMRKEQVGKDNRIRIKVVRNLTRDLRNFEALGRLPWSPLSPCIINPRSNNFKRVEVVDKQPVFEFPLNDSQKMAVLGSAQSVTQKKPIISLIHGPPGTGKTQVIVAIILEVLYGNQLPKEERPKILLCAPSNAAIDEIVCRLMDLREQMPPGMKYWMVRNGRLKAMHPRVAQISSETLAMREVESTCDPESLQVELSVLRAAERATAMVLEDPGKGQQWKNKEKYARIQEQIVALERLLKNQNVAEKKHSPHMKKRMFETEMKILQHAEIVATTISSCYSNVMREAFGNINSQSFACCIVDEATQAIEPDSLLPLLLNVNNLIMVGDPQQLPATVLSKVAKTNGLERSLFARLYNVWIQNESSLPLYVLNSQFRMHPEIVKWPSSYFYNGKVTTPPEALQNVAPSPLVPYKILKHTSEQDKQGETNSREAIIISQLLSQIQSLESCRASSIGVIVPYQRQRFYILQLLQSMELLTDRIDVQTIDSYQGQERDIVIFSCVRTEGIGFLCDANRLNVALTRAKSTLIIVGNFISLKMNGAWSSLLKDAERRKKTAKIPQDITPSELLKLVLS